MITHDNYDHFQVLTVFFWVQFDNDPKLQGTMNFIIDLDVLPTDTNQAVVDKNNLVVQLTKKNYPDANNFWLDSIRAEYNQHWLVNISQYLKETNVKGIYIY